MTQPIRNADGEELDATWHGGGQAGAVVVLGHGVTGNKDRPFATALASGLEAAGRSALRFSFSGNGESGGAFEASTISKEVADLGAVLDSLAGRPVAYVGHSMGAAVGVQRASRDPRIRLLISLAGMVRTAEFCERKFGELTPGLDCMWALDGCPLSQAYVDDMQAVGDVLPAAAGIQVPWLLVHGDADTVVPYADSEAALAASSGRAELIRLPGADHVFTPPALDAMTAAVLDWLLPRLEQLEAPA